MKTLKTWVDKIISFICVVIFSSLVATVTWQVFTRFVLKNPSATSEELAKILFVWLSFFAAALLFGEKGHLNISVVKDKFKGKKLLYLDLACEIIILLFAAFILVGGGFKIVSNGITQTNATITWLKTGQIYSVVPISGLIIIFYNIYGIIGNVVGLLKKDNEKIG